MSMGFGGKLILIAKDSDYLMFQYSSFDYNDENSEIAQNTFDGIIIIYKDYFQNLLLVERKLKNQMEKKYGLIKENIQSLITKIL